MKMTLKKITVLITILIAVLSAHSITYATSHTGTPTTEYTVLVPLPNTTTCGTGAETPAGCKSTLTQYLPAAFNLIVGIAVALAFVMITFGGVMYATSDAISGKSQGREYIENALWGLLLVIGSYTILYTLNPQILDFTLDINRAPATTGTAPIIVTTTCPTCADMRAVGIPVKSSANGGISSVMLPKLVALNTSLGPPPGGLGIPWRVNEGYPPTATHRDPCHQNGTCIDARTIDQSPGNINAFAEAARAAGMRPVYEVATDGERRSLIDRGVTTNIIIVPGINGSHFSVYNQ